MKKIFLSIIAGMLLSTAVVYADNGKRTAKKKAVKKECKKNCKKADCDKAKCDKTCASMPGCH